MPKSQCPLSLTAIPWETAGVLCPRTRFPYTVTEHTCHEVAVIQFITNCGGQRFITDGDFP